MAFDRTYNFDVRTIVNSEWDIVDRAGAVQGNLSNANTNGDICFETNGTTSNGTGPTGPDTGFAGYIVTEASGPVASSTWSVSTVAAESLLATEEINFELLNSKDADAGAQLIIEYSTSANPTTTTNNDWTVITTIAATDGNNAWVLDSGSVSNVGSTSNLRFRIRWDTPNSFSNDIGLQQFRIFTTSTVVGNPPTINIPGDNPLNLTEGDVYVAPIVTASDVEDGDLTSSIVITGDTVDTAVTGTYSVTYTVTDIDNNTTQEILFVNVLAPSPYQFIPASDVFVNFPTGPSNWSLSGNIITQSGQGTLEGLEAIAGVNVCEVLGKTVYDVASGNRQLNITGTLFIDPEVEMLLMGYDGTTELFNVINNGILVLGRFIDQLGFRRHSIGTAIDFENTQTVGSFIDRVSFEDNSTLHWFGGTVALEGGKFGFYGDDVTVRIYSLEAKLLFRTQNEQNQIRQETDDFISESFDFINGDFTVVGTQQQLNGYRPTHCTGSLAWSSATPNEDVFIRNYGGGGRGNIVDGKHWQGQRGYLINSESGSNLNSGPHIVGNNSSFGSYRIDQEIQFNIQDSNNQPVSNALIFMRDTDNGDRRIYNEEGNLFDESGDRTYVELTNTGGSSSVFPVRIANQFAARNFGSANDSINTGRYAWDRRGKSNDTSDRFDFHIWAYGFRYQLVPDVVLKGAGGTQINITLPVQPEFTEPNESVALNFTEFNVDDLYDRSRAWKSIPGNEEIPAADRPLIDISGSNLDLKEYTLDFGPGFDINGTTITFNPKNSLIGNQFTGIIANGNILTLRNQADFDLISNMSFPSGTILVDAGSADADFTVDSANINDIINIGTGIVNINTIGAASVTTSEPGQTAGLINIVNTIQITINELLGNGEEIRIFNNTGTLLEPVAGVLVAGIENNFSSSFNFEASANQGVIIVIIDNVLRPIFRPFIVPTTDSSIQIPLNSNGVYLNP